MTSRKWSAGLKSFGTGSSSAAKCAEHFDPASPEYINRPPLSKTSRSTRAYMLLRGWCTLATIVLPFVTARSLRADMTLSAWNASSPLVGSSIKMSRGSCNRSIPMATRLRSPPEMPRICSFPTIVSAALTRPRSAITSSTAASFAASETSGPSRSCAAKSRVSRTVDKAKSASSCST